LLSIPLAAALALCASCAQHPATVVFFKPNSASLDDTALAIVQQASSAARANSTAAVTVVGFASPETGTVESNKALAQARAQAVANALVAAGVAQERIRIQPWGARAYGLTPIESHRVEIVVS
jgi:cytochrome c oxidase subunit 2